MMVESPAHRLAVTSGDPRGIGPEVVRKAGAAFRAERPDIQLIEFGEFGNSDSITGMDGRSAGSIAGRAIEEAVELALSGGVGAIVTGPIHKPSLQAAGWDFPGQTELLQKLSGADRVGMLMAAERTRLGAPLRVLLATTHLALRDVPARVTEELLFDQTRLLFDSLRSGWGIPAPRIALCALNPHASDEGLFGDEEAQIYGPVMARLTQAGFSASGPVPADTVFRRMLEGDFDAVVAPYHDVGMAAFKTASFGSGVNVTLGLPFVRTSPDHGTAFSLAGKGVADASSTLEALRLAAAILSHRFDSLRAQP